MISDEPASPTIGQALTTDRAKLRAHRLTRALSALEDRVRVHDTGGSDVPVPLRLAVEDFRKQLALLRRGESETAILPASLTPRSAS